MVSRIDSSVPALWPSAHRSTRMGRADCTASDCLGLSARGHRPDRRGAGARSDRCRAARSRVRALLVVPLPPRCRLGAGRFGALIAARRPHNPIGWILVLGALSLAAVLAATPYAWVALDAHPGSLPGGSWAALVSSLWPAFFAWPLAVAFVFPDGRLPSPRWRPYALFAAGSMASWCCCCVMADQLEEPFSDVPNPFPLRLPDALGFLRALAWLAVFASLFVGAAAARIRYRRSEGIERLQLLWLAYTAILIPLGMVCFLLWGLCSARPATPCSAFCSRWRLRSRSRSASR